MRDIATQSTCYHALQDDDFEWFRCDACSATFFKVNKTLSERFGARRQRSGAAALGSPKSVGRGFGRWRPSLACFSKSCVSLRSGGNLCRQEKMLCDEDSIFHSWIWGHFRNSRK